MSRMFRLPKYISGDKLADFHPGKVELSSKGKTWEGVHFTRYSHPKTSRGCPRPATTDHILAFSDCGAVKGDYSFNGDTWQPYTWRTHEWLIGQAYENDRDSRWHSLCDEKTELSVCYIHIDPSLLSKVALQTMDKSPQFIELPHKFGFTDPLMLQLGLHIRDELKNDNLYGKIYVETAVNMLAVHLLKNYASEKFNFPTIKNARNRLIISRVIEYIQSNLDRDLSLSELASIANRSAFHFAHLFKNVTGAAPHAYITQQRIARAKRLLQNTSLSISTIAMDVGYSPSHFSQVFIRHVGINPRTYRLKS